MNNENLWHIHELIFGYLDYDTVERCRKVCKSWKESLKRISLIRFIQEFGDRSMERYREGTVSTYIPGWKKAVLKYGARASIEDLQEVIGSLRRLVEYEREGECCHYPVHEAAKIGAVKLMEIILDTSFDLNARDYSGMTALHEACSYGRFETVKLMINSSKDVSIDLNARCHSYTDYGCTPLHFACKSVYIGGTETVEFMIKSSKDFGIDLNARNSIGSTPLHWACEDASVEIVELMVKNWKELCIDIQAQDDDGVTPLDVTNWLHRYSSNKNLKNLKQIEEMLKNEYSKMDDAEQSD